MLGRDRKRLCLTRRSFLEKAAGLAGSRVFLGASRLFGAIEGITAPGQGTAVVSGRVRDAKTKQVIPCTVTIRASQGKIVTDNRSFKQGFRSDGQFEKAVPAGEVTITVSRGFDYIAVKRKVRLREGERAELAFELHRRANLRRLGWYCGDNHVHMIHGERAIIVDFPYVARAARAAGLDYMSLAQDWNLASPTPARLEQACKEVSTEDFQLIWNMEAPKNYWRGNVSKCLGHGWTLGARGYTPEGKSANEELTEMNAGDYESEKDPAPNFETHALVHSLRGIVSYTHPCRWWWGRWGGRGIYPLEEGKFISNLAQELPYDTVVGPTYDTIDILMQPEENAANEKALQLWFMLLNQGYRMPATASSDATFDNPGGAVPGRARVYTRVHERNLGRIVEAMRAGRNFVTTGPLLLLELGNYQIGDVIPGSTPIRLAGKVKAWAAGTVGSYLRRVEVIRNGELVKRFEISSPRTEFSTEFEVSEAKTAWYVVRCIGSGAGEEAITNPIYFEMPDYHAPTPTLARVVGRVTDKDTGRPLGGTCEVIQMVGKTPVKQSERQVREGHFVAEVPGTARLCIRVPGYLPMMKSIFMDYAPLLNLTLNVHSSELIDWRTFEEIRGLLREVHLKFAMAKEAQS